MRRRDGMLFPAVRTAQLVTGFESNRLDICHGSQAVSIHVGVSVRSVFGLWLAVVITDMDQDKDTRPDDRPTKSDTASDLTSFLEQRVRIPLDQSTSTQHSSSSNDVVFRVAQDRRRSPTNILPYQQRRSVDQR